MKKIKVKKLWNNCVSVRDYDIEKAKEQGGLIIEFEGEKMMLSKEGLEKGKPSGVKVRSKWGNKIYELIDFEWKPQQIKLFKRRKNGIQNLHQKPLRVPRL